MGGFDAVKHYRRHRIVMVAETSGPRSKPQQSAFRNAIKRVFEQHAAVMLPPQSGDQHQAYKKALDMILATNPSPETAAKAKRVKRKPTAKKAAARKPRSKR